MTQTLYTRLCELRDWMKAKLLGHPQFCKRCGLRAGREPPTDE